MNLKLYKLIQNFIKGNDDVAVCQVNSNGSISLRHNYNGDSSSNLLLSSNPTVGFSNIVTSFQNGVATCNFTRANSLPAVTNYLNQNSQYYLLSATGPLNTNGLFDYEIYNFLIHLQLN